MIGHLRGTLLEKHPNHVLVETGGVGYEVQIPVSTFSALPDTGSEVRLRIHTHVREDAFSLFGFLTLEEKQLFEKLISVSGIGPKLGITVLSGLPTGELVTSIRENRLEQLVRIPGVGKKTAERMVLELRDKLDLFSAPSGREAKPAGSTFSSVEQDVISALVNMQCKQAAAEEAIRKAKAAGVPDEFESLFRQAFQFVR
ncbi:MAG TPA: Holliday junction branch migration protein RuvA [Bryobacteraceae bacterium]|nr:Holliday junction branch migration protein RuvA [Bryobacteraceae bacterium]